MLFPTLFPALLLMPQALPFSHQQARRPTGAALVLPLTPGVMGGSGCWAGRYWISPCTRSPGRSADPRGAILHSLTRLAHSPGNREIHIIDTDYKHYAILQLSLRWQGKDFHVLKYYSKLPGVGFCSATACGGQGEALLSPRYHTARSLEDEGGPGFWRFRELTTDTGLYLVARHGEPQVFGVSSGLGTPWMGSGCLSCSPSHCFCPTGRCAKLLKEVSLRPACVDLHLGPWPDGGPGSSTSCASRMVTTGCQAGTLGVGCKGGAGWRQGRGLGLGPQVSPSKVGGDTGGSACSHPARLGPCGHVSGPCVPHT